MDVQSTSRQVEIQDRDVELLRGLFDARLMTLAHAAALHFNGSREAAKKRVGKLKAAGFLTERTRKPYEPGVFHLTRVGLDLLRDRGVVDGVLSLSSTEFQKRTRVSDLTLRHELQVMDVKATLSAALRQLPVFRVVDFSTSPAACQFRAAAGDSREVLVKPDGFLRIHEEQNGEKFEYLLYLEIDRGTETLDTLATKAACYLDYYQTGGLAERLGRSRSEYKDFPFRVLMLFQTAERRNNAAERLLRNEPPIFTLTWLATLKEFLADPLGRFWVRPRDVRDALAGSTFDTNSAASGTVYRRQTERDQLIEEKSTRQPLFDS